MSTRTNVFYNTEEIFQKFFEIGMCKFTLCGNNTHNKLWWFDIEIAKRIFQFSKGTGKYSPVRATIQYQSDKGSGFGTGAILVDNIQQKIFDNENHMSEFIARLKMNTGRMVDANKCTFYNNMLDYYNANNNVLKYFIIDSCKENKVTYQMWRDSKLLFSDFMKDRIGCDVDDELYYYVLDNMSHRLVADYAMMKGEPYLDDENDTYISFINLFGRWFYAGYRTVDDIKLFKKVKADCEYIETATHIITEENKGEIDE